MIHYPEDFTSSVPNTYHGGPADTLARVSEPLRSRLTDTRGDAPFGALIIGPTGCGKSTAAAALLRRWQQRTWRERAKLEVLKNHEEGTEGFERALQEATHYSRQPKIGWLDAIELTDQERRYKLGSGEPKALADAQNAEWLCLDDVGLSTSPALVQLILAKRYQWCKATIVTSGLTAEALSAHIGAATVRRIVECKGEAGLFVDCHPVQKDA